MIERLRGVVPTPGPFTRMYGVLGLVALVMTIAAAGVLSGVGLFIISMIEMTGMSVVLSSLLLSFSVAVFLLCYGWLTA